MFERQANDARGAGELGRVVDCALCGVELDSRRGVRGAGDTFGCHQEPSLITRESTSCCGFPCRIRSFGRSKRRTDARARAPGRLSHREYPACVGLAGSLRATVAPFVGSPYRGAPRCFTAFAIRG